jgi:hypothetical protein
MSKKQARVMTAKQFAEQMKVNYRTALNWLEASLVPGAERKPSPVGEYWEIPDTALKMERPKRGPVPKGQIEAKPKRGRKAA